MILNERLFRSRIEDFEEFYNFIFEIKQSGTQQQKQQISKIYFKIPNSIYGIPASTILHDNKKHNLKLQDWKDLINNIDSYETYVESNKQQGFRGKNYLYKYYFEDEYFGVGICDTKECDLITTFFRDSEKGIDAWLQQNKAQREAPSTVNRHGSLLTEGLNNIITSFPKNVNLNERLAYHGTNSQFMKFDPKFFGRMDYGKGFYFTPTKPYAQDYGKYVLTCEIPDDQYYLDYDDPWEWGEDYIKEAIMKLSFSLKGENREKFEDCIYGDFNTGFYIIYCLAEIFNSMDKAIDYMYKFGIKGLYSFKGDCFVVFKAEDIKIVKTEMNETFSSLNEKLQKYIV